MLEFKICTFYTDGNVSTSEVILVCYAVTINAVVQYVKCNKAETDQHGMCLQMFHKAEDCKLLPYNLVRAEQS